MSEPEELLDVLTVSGLLRLPVRMARRWVQSKVPKDAVQRQGRHVYVTMWGIREGLCRSRWQPKPRKGYQYRPGRRPINADCRDELGRFTSYRPSGPRAPKQRTSILPPAVRPYLKRTD